MPTTITMHTII